MTKAICHIYGQLSQTGLRMGDVLAHLEENKIPADISFNVDIAAADLANVRRWQSMGNVVAPDVYPGTVDRSCTNSNWWTYSKKDCIRLIKAFKKTLKARGFSRFDAINTYTPGNEFVAACKELGIEYLLGFCAPTVINDGHWQITHSGSPLSPYFAGSEDFRKPEMPESKKALLIASMELRNPITCRENWSEGPFCPLNLIMGDRTIESGDLPVETIAMCEDFIRLSELTGVPRFFHINLQYFTSTKCFDFNYRMLDWLAEQRDAGRLEFTGLKAYAKRLRENNGLVPQATYWRGECMGQMVGGQPGNGHEAVIVESMDGQWQFRRGASGAERFFDYRKTWKFPAFEPKGELPKSDGYEATSRILKTIDSSSQRELVVQVDPGCPHPGLTSKNLGEGTPAPTRRIAVWDTLEGLAAPFRVVSCDEGVTAEVVPHPGGTGGVVLVTGTEQSRRRGRRPRPTVRIVIGHSGKKANNHSRRIRDLISVETTWVESIPVTRLAALVPYEMKLSLRVAGRGKVGVEFINGGDFGGELLPVSRVAPVTLDGTRSTSMVRFWGVTADALVFDKGELDAIQVRLGKAAARFGRGKKDAPYLTCVPEKDYPVWIKRAASRGADADIAKATAIVRKRFGVICAAYHMTSDLPFGSKGRVRSQFFDRQERNGKEEFFPLFYDYGQSYGPGITGWNQFLRINLGLRGLDKKGRYRLVLQLFDPEKRNTRLRITACATDAHGEARTSPDVMLRDPFLVAQGIEARYTDDAFVSLRLPKQCRTDKAVNIGIHSHSEYRLYDRLTEGFGFVYLSHAWLVLVKDKVSDHL